MPISSEGNEPQIPNDLGGMPDPQTGEYNSNNTSEEEIQQSPEEEENLGETKETEIPNIKKEVPETPNGEEKEVEEAKDAVFEGWKVDRTRLSELSKENREIREKLARYEENDEDFLGLSEEERVEKMVERREQERKLRDETEKAETDSEIRWHRSKDPYFKENEERILKNAVAFNSSSLSDAIKITKQQDSLTKKAQATNDYNEKRKKSAAGVGESKSGGTHITGYDPKVDGEKSISQIYEEGGF